MERTHLQLTERTGFEEIKINKTFIRYDINVNVINVKFFEEIKDNIFIVLFISSYYFYWRFLNPLDF